MAANLSMQLFNPDPKVIQEFHFAQDEGTGLGPTLEYYQDLGTYLTSSFF